MLEPPLTDRATADRSWLRQKLGRRLGEPVPDGVMLRWRVEILKQDGKCCWYYGSTLEEVYREIRRDAELAIEHQRRRRSLS